MRVPLRSGSQIEVSGKNKELNTTHKECNRPSVGYGRR
jgi:hypothetical protein